mgnify:CR=1 FL=1
MKRKLNLRKILVLSIIILLGFSTFSCTTRQKRKIERIPETGIMGVIIPVSGEGEIIESQPRDEVVINCTFMDNGGGKVYTVNPDPEGRFKVLLKNGNYRIEIFLKGFKVKSLEVNIPPNTMLDLGEIKLVRIETQMGKPFLGEEDQTPLLNEGDVSIQPPSS